jgi:hypothetical protein
MLEVVATEWRNNNRNVNYPFSDAATLTSEEGVSFDRDSFDDARVYLTGSSGKIYIPRVNLVGSTVTIHVGDTVSGELARAVYDYNSPPDDLPIYDLYGRPAGVFVSSVERLAALGTRFSQGDTSFRVEATEFAPSVAIGLPSVGVWGILLDDGNILSGDIWLVGEEGVVVWEEDGFIRIDAMGDPYALLRECEGLGQPLPVFCGLKTINGIAPDSNGDFKLLPGGNISTQPIVRITANGQGQLIIRLLGGSGVMVG